MIASPSLLMPQETNKPRWVPVLSVLVASFFKKLKT